MLCCSSILVCCSPYSVDVCLFESNFSLPTSLSIRHLEGLYFAKGAEAEPGDLISVSSGNLVNQTVPKILIKVVCCR